MSMSRRLRHLFTAPWTVRRHFPDATLARIEQAIAATEAGHAGQVCFAIEASLDGRSLWAGQTAASRALEVFGQLRVWDTEHNNGLLIYVLLADRAVELVADRGIAAKVAQAEWDAICRRMETAFRERRFEAGSLAAIGEISALLQRHFPPLGNNPNELPDRPLVL
jgi:uncharacterized membrane protein